MPAKKHNFTVTEIKAGIMVLASIGVFAAFAVSIAGMWPEPEQNVYVCYFKDTLGLNKGADVRFGGVKIGRVRSVAADTARVAEAPPVTEPAEDSDEPVAQVQAPIIRVEAAIDPGVPINEQSFAYIGQTTLTAEKHLEITTGLPQSRRLAAGEEIPVGLGGGLFDQAGGIAKSVESGIESVKALLGVEQAMVESSDGKLDTTIVTLLRGVDQAVSESKGLVGDARNIMGQYRGDIGTVINEVIKIEQSANALVAELNGLVADNRVDIQNTVQQLPTLLGRVDALADDLEVIAMGLQSTLESTGDTIEDNRPAIEETIIDLRDTVGNLKTFSRNLAEQPESVLWGKSQKERKGE
ncbi:MAG TPA: MlaD family protein [Candidatus Hydrogenedentes bacterium]|nr:MlaD family protein [Candidatus Hydrogenedentota bacterium]HRK34344.1 MlaD family protein [Candidatus Hydrogenedentota bacterium]